MTGTAAILLGLALAGAAGAVLRHEVLVRCGPAGSRSRAVGVAAVNVAGSVVAGLTLVSPLSAGWQVVVVTGLAGSLTTFSTWAVEAVLGVQAGRSATSVAVLDLAGQLAVGSAIVLVLLRTAS